MTGLTRKHMLIIGALAVVLLAVAIFFIFKEEDKSKDVKKDETVSKNTVEQQKALNPQQLRQQLPEQKAVEHLYLNNSFAANRFNDVCDEECVPHVPECNNYLSTMVEKVGLQYVNTV